MSRQIELLRARRFLPLLLTQVTGAFNDNLFKSAFVMIVTYGAASADGRDPAMVAALAAAALIAPFFLFSATAGELADRFERSRLLQILKAAELAAVLAAGVALLTGGLAPALVCLFLLGAQATFASPVKYALLAAASRTRRTRRRQRGYGGGHVPVDPRRHHRRRDRGRGVVGAGRRLSAACVLCCAAGLAASFRVPGAPPPSPELQISRNPFAATAAILREAHERRVVWLSILGASWFWLVGARAGVATAVFCQDDVSAPAAAWSSCSSPPFRSASGSARSLCGRLMRGEVSARYVPLAALGMALFSLDLALASRHAVHVPPRGADRRCRISSASPWAAHLRRPPGPRDLAAASSSCRSTR